MKHTKGQWHVGFKGADSVFAEDGSRICTVMPRYDDPYRSSQEDFANARLIAAAPDLLHAVQYVLNGIDGDGTDWGDVKRVLLAAERKARPVSARARVLPGSTRQTQPPRLREKGAAQ